jgi:hypothetical protein
VQNGTLLQSLIKAMLESGKHFLVRHECAPTMLSAEPSDERCESTCPDDMTRPVTASATFQLVETADSGGEALRSAALKEEILQNGPVVAVLALGSELDILNFDNLAADKVFVPQDPYAVCFLPAAQRR